MVAGLRRYPVKSLSGESLAVATVERRGLVGDRAWAVRDLDGKLGSGKSTRRFRRMDGLLGLAAVYDGERPVVGLPDGRRLPAGDPALDQALSGYVGRAVTLSREAEVSHFDEGPVHLVTTAALGAVARAHGRPVDWRHTRANLLVDWPGEGLVEHAWSGRRVRVGAEVVLRVVDVMPRCVMVTSAQQDLPADADLLKTVTDSAGGALGVFAVVEHPGRVSLGDEVTLLEP